MKKTQFTDALRNVSKQKVSFLSIIVIAMLGVTTFLGIDYTAVSMRQNGMEFYDRLNYRDIEVVSTMMFTPEDIEEVRKIEGVTDIEPIYYTSGKADLGGEIINTEVVSLTKRVNLVDVGEGVLPSAADECAIELWCAEKYGIKCGDRVTVTGSDGGRARFLSAGEFTVTAIVVHPDHLNTAVLQTPYVILPGSSFDSEELDGCYMKLEVVTDKKANVDRFSSGYTSKTEKILNQIEDLGYVRADMRDKDKRGEYQGEIDENKKKLDEAERQLNEARKLLDEKTAELNEAEILLAETKAKLTEAEIKIADGKKELEDAKATLDGESGKLIDGKAKLDEAKEKLDQAKLKLEEGRRSIEDGKAAIRQMVRSAFEKAFPNDSYGKLIEWAENRDVELESDEAEDAVRYLWITKNIRLDLEKSAEVIAGTVLNSGILPNELLVPLYEIALSKDAPMKAGDYDYKKIKQELTKYLVDSSGSYKQLTDGVAEWRNGYRDYMTGYEEYRKGLEEYENGKALFEEAEAKYADGVAEYEKALAEYNEGKEKYEKGVSDYEDGKTQIADGESSYATAETEFYDGKNAIEKAQRELDGIDPCRWISYDCRGSVSFVQLSSGTANFVNIKSTFSVLFVIVGALVIFATVGKMIDEQRRLVGTTKALGFFNYEIFSKYLGFGVSATLIGVILGVLAARFGLMPFLLVNFDKYYLFDMTKGHLNVPATIGAVVVGILLTVFAVWLASTKLLREPAVRLMQPKLPGVSKGSGKKSSLPLYTRLILLNMRTDLKRVIVTIVSVAGCCALIVTGITLRGAIIGSVDRQYNDIVAYDISVKFDPNASEETAAKIENALKSAKTEYTGICLTSVTYRITELRGAELICGDIDEINKFHHLSDQSTGKPLFATNEGVLIQSRISEIYGLSYGDRFDLALGGTKTARVRVGGVFLNYIGGLIVISDEYYRNVFEEEPVRNAFLVRLCGADADKLTEELRGIEGFETVKRADEDRALIESSTSTVNSVVVLFIFVAAMMAGIVLTNLTNMYIMQKKQELTIMRINGFTTKEVIGYVLRETFLTTALGLILGIGVGAVIAYNITLTLEQIFTRFDRSVNPTAWLIAAATTVFFTVLVNVFSLRKVKNLKLTDVA